MTEEDAEEPKNMFHTIAVTAPKVTIPPGVCALAAGRSSSSNLEDHDHSSMLALPAGVLSRGSVPCVAQELWPSKGTAA